MGEQRRAKADERIASAPGSDRPPQATPRAARRAPALVLALALATLLAAPAQAIAPDGRTAAEPYQYPAGTDESEAYPRGWVRVPAAAADLLVVRPVMLVGLVAGAGLFVATLPFTAPTRTTDDAAHAIFDQTLDALARPLGTF